MIESKIEEVVGGDAWIDESAIVIEQVERWDRKRRKLNPSKCFGRLPSPSPLARLASAAVAGALETLQVPDPLWI